MALPLSYNWKNLTVRKVSTLLTVAGVGVVIFVFTALSAFVSGLERTLRITADEANVLVLKQGATAESNSALDNEEYIKVANAGGARAAAAECVTIAGLHRRGDSSGNWANVPVRGVAKESIQVHDKVKIVEGMGWEQFIGDAGRRNIIVGRGAARQYQNLEIGGKVKLGFGGTDEFTVVGIFEAGGGVFESEIWGYRSHIMEVYNRRMYSSITVRGESAGSVNGIKEFVEGPSVQLTGMSEKEYFEKQTESTKPFLVLSWGLLIFMGIAAGFAIANNMYAMVAGRMREIAMLRAVGFGKGAILTSFLIESLMLSLVGGALGCLAATPLRFLSQDMIGGNNTFTAIVFNFDVGPRILATSMGLALFLGIVGAIFPALRAARTPVVTALRQV